jgi:phosphoadenosine phosphosulfate reductase
MIVETYEELSAADLVDRVLQENPGPACLTCSFQLEDMVVLHLLRQRQKDIPVLFLDTGYHFAETYRYRDRMAREWNINLINLQPEQSVPGQEAEFGILYKTDPGKCCHLRKVVPLFGALRAYKVWFTGLRREQSPSRKDLKLLEQHQLPGDKCLLKVSPLAMWNWRQVRDYALEHSIEPLPLYAAGYPSIGCQPCTAIPAAGADPRSGRWGGTKLECGIHTGTNRADSWNR